MGVSMNNFFKKLLDFSLRVFLEFLLDQPEPSGFGGGELVSCRYFPILPVAVLAWFRDNQKYNLVRKNDYGQKILVAGV